MNDLFGQPMVEFSKPTKFDKKKRKLTAKGYSRPPGTGPKGETCKTCRHATKRCYRKGFWKCGLMCRLWTASVTTDIRLKSPACEMWASKFPLPAVKPQTEEQ